MFLGSQKARKHKKFQSFKATKVDLSKSFSIPYSTLQTILKQDVSVELKSEKMGNLSKKRKTYHFEELEKILYE